MQTKVKDHEFLCFLCIYQTNWIELLLFDFGSSKMSLAEWEIKLQILIQAKVGRFRQQITRFTGFSLYLYVPFSLTCLGYPEGCAN